MNFLFYISLCLFLKSTTIIAGNTHQNTIERIIYSSNSDRNITFEEISQLYHLPIEDAAQELGISLSVLKRVCRKNGLERWPHRKFKSIRRFIEYCKETDDKSSLERLEGCQRKLGENPNTPYNELLTKSQTNHFNVLIKKKNTKEFSNYKDFPDSNTTKPEPPALPTDRDLFEPENEESKENELLPTDDSGIVQESMDQTSDSETKQDDMDVQENELPIGRNSDTTGKKSFDLSDPPMDDATKIIFDKIWNECARFINYDRLFGNSRE